MSTTRVDERVPAHLALRIPVETPKISRRPGRCAGPACRRKDRSPQGGGEDLRRRARRHARQEGRQIDASSAGRYVLRQVRQPEDQRSARTRRAVSLEFGREHHRRRQAARRLHRQRREEAPRRELRRRKSGRPNRDGRRCTRQNVPDETRRRRFDKPEHWAAESVLQLGNRTRARHGESGTAHTQAPRIRARTAPRAGRGGTAPGAHERRLALAASARRGVGDRLTHRGDSQRSIQTVALGSQRAAPIEPDDQGIANAVRAALAGAPRDARATTTRSGWRRVRTGSVRVRQRSRRTPEELSEGVVDASATRARPRAALGTERQVPALLPPADREDEPPHARPAARGWQPAARARRGSAYRPTVLGSRKHLHQQSLLETVEARAAHDDSTNRRATARERRSEEVGARAFGSAEKLAAAATKAATS